MLNRLFLLASLALAPAAALAGDALADDDEDLFKTDASHATNAGVPDASAFGADPDEIDIPAYVAPVKVEPKAEAAKAPAGKLPLDVAGKAPLADNWGPTVVATDADVVVVEMPVLYANGGQGFDGTAYWLVAEVYAAGTKVAESRTWVAKDSVALKGPSVQFFRLLAPVGTPSGVLEVKVSKLGTASGAKPALLISRSVNYQLPG